jgi:Aspartyl/Asparaginyl beta-hydroxylase
MMATCTIGKMVKEARVVNNLLLVRCAHRSSRLTFSSVSYTQWTVMFDDTYLHVARNDADETRVVLLVDVLRRGLPWWWNLYNHFSVWIAEHDTRVTAVQAKVSIPPPTSYATNTEVEAKD